jgi:formiminotetrahydrofolate cyclodeaminase
LEKQVTIPEFIDCLSSSSPTPGGGGVAALSGALSAALCSMVGNLTTGKKKYAEYQADIERIIADSQAASKVMYDLIEKDAQCFEPLSRAYSLPKDNPDRDAILEDALKLAASCPAQIMDEALKIICLFEELAVKGSRLALSDVGVAATMCESTIKSSLLNIMINTKLMKDREYATKMNDEYIKKANDGIIKCQLIYNKVAEEL